MAGPLPQRRLCCPVVSSAAVSTHAVDLIGDGVSHGHKVPLSTVVACESLSLAAVVLLPAMPVRPFGAGGRPRTRRRGAGCAPGPATAGGESALHGVQPPNVQEAGEVGVRADDRQSVLEAERGEHSVADEIAAQVEIADQLTK